MGYLLHMARGILPPGTGKLVPSPPRVSTDIAYLILSSDDPTLINWRSVGFSDGHVMPTHLIKCISVSQVGVSQNVLVSFTFSLDLVGASSLDIKIIKTFTVYQSTVPATLSDPLSDAVYIDDEHDLTLVGSQMVSSTVDTSFPGQYMSVHAVQDFPVTASTANLDFMQGLFAIQPHGGTLPVVATYNVVCYVLVTLWGP